jgi:hypothetical protein
MMIANMSAYVLARHWRHTAIYDALLEQDGIFLERPKDPDENSGGSQAREGDALKVDATS